MMIVVKFDGVRFECSKIEMSTDGKNLILDDCFLVPILEVVRIFAKK